MKRSLPAAWNRLPFCKDANPLCETLSIILQSVTPKNLVPLLETISHFAECNSHFAMWNQISPYCMKQTLIPRNKIPPYCMERTLILHSVTKVLPTAWKWNGLILQCGTKYLPTAWNRLILRNKIPPYCMKRTPTLQSVTNSLPTAWNRLILQCGTKSLPTILHETDCHSA